jgi:hypothetical protein
MDLAFRRILSCIDGSLPLLATTAALLATTAALPATTAALPAMTAALPAMTAGLLATTAGLPATTAGLLAMTAVLPAMTTRLLATTATDTQHRRDCRTSRLSFRRISYASTGGGSHAAELYGGRKAARRLVDRLD